MMAKGFSAAQRRMMQHGLLVLLLGLVSGFGLAWNAIGEVNFWPLPIAFPDALPGDVALWRAAHSGNLMNGLMAIAFAVSFAFVDLRARTADLLSWLVVAAIWCNAAFYVFRLWAPGRGLSIGEGTTADALAFLPAYAAAFVTVGVVAVLALNVRKAD